MLCEILGRRPSSKQADLWVCKLSASYPVVQHYMYVESLKSYSSACTFKSSTFATLDNEGHPIPSLILDVESSHSVGGGE